MASLQGEDLGSGVYVSPAENGQLVVTSPRLGLEWRVAEGRVPGTAVLWRGRSFEVIARVAAGNGHRWVLRPWPDAGAMRDVVPLDAAFVATNAERHAADRRGERNRLWTFLLLPVLGLAPAKVQERWQSEWLFPAELATWVSAALEMLGGGFGFAQAAVLAFGNEWFLPGPLKFLAVVGPLMLAEAIVRLVLVSGRGEPVGSVVGLPLILFEKPEERAAPATGPEVRSFDDEQGVLELVSPVNRTDWGHDGLLPFRERWYALDRADREGRSWTYLFTRCEEGPGEHRVLRLHPPLERPFVAPRHTSPPPSILRTTLLTAAVTLGPRADQERWAGQLGVDPRWLTIAGAAAELVGGLVNFGRDAAAGGAFFVMIDVLLIVEGSWRLLTGLGGRPVGSVIGWVLRPFYRSFLPPEP
jgi:hypothetical protein